MSDSRPPNRTRPRLRARGGDAKPPERNIEAVCQHGLEFSPLASSSLDSLSLSLL